MGLMLMRLLVLGTAMHQMQIVVATATGTAVITAAVAQFNSASRGQWIVFTSIIIGIEKFLEPLQELEIVLKTSLNKLINCYYLFSFAIVVVVVVAIVGVPAQYHCGYFVTEMSVSKTHI